MFRLFQDNQIIGEYRIDGFLGAGGMGEVYRGIHLKLNRVAAIKVLKNLRDNEALIQRFYNEARVQSNLHHPNIAVLYDFQQINNQLYIFMEYVDGECLEDLIKARYFTVEDAIKTFKTICEAVAFIHRYGIVHRDIKSQNIKLNSKGAVKLLDFGIAKDADSAKLTRTGGVIGTPNYISPEQLAGQPADFQTDVWSLGIVFYEMLTGEQPFNSENYLELYRSIESGEYAPIQKMNGAVSGEISAIVSRCLNKEKLKRYRDASELAAELSRVLKDRYKASAPSVDKIVLNNYHALNEDQKSEKKSAARKRQRSFFTKILAGTSAAVFLVFALIGTAFWSMSGSENISKNSSSNENKIALTAGKPDNKKGLEKLTIPTGKKEGETVEVRIDIVEGSAEFIRDGAIEGKTPYTIKGKIGEKVDIKLRREGFKDFQTQIEISNSKKFYTFSMQKN